MGLFWFSGKGGRDYITPKRRQGLYLVYKRYILPIGSLYTSDHLQKNLKDPLTLGSLGLRVWVQNFFGKTLGLSVSKTQAFSHPCLVGGLTNPSENRQIGTFPQVGMKTTYF